MKVAPIIQRLTLWLSSMVARLISPVVLLLFFPQRFRTDLM